MLKFITSFLREIFQFINRQLLYVGIKNGMLVEYDNEGRKRYEALFVNGKIIGKDIAWYENGQKDRERDWDNGNLSKKTYWHENGQKWSEDHYKNGKEDGLSTSWHEVNGQKRSETNYKDGLRDGLVTEWHENGQKKYEGYYKNGNQDGLVIEWHFNGQKDRECYFKDGDQEGLETSWGPCGTKAREAHYKNGKQDGLETWWYVDDNREPPFLDFNFFYDSDNYGNKQSEFHYKDGKLVSASVWKINGEPCPISCLIDGTGMLIEYYPPQGDLKFAVEYFDGKVVHREKHLFDWWKFPDPKHRYSDSTLGTIANFYFNRGSWGQAAIFYKRSLDIDEKKLGPNHPVLSYLLQDLGVIYDSQNKFEEAETLLKRSLAINEKHLGPNHPDVAMTLTALAVVYRKTDREPEAVKLEKRSAEIEAKELRDRVESIKETFPRFERACARGGEQCSVEYSPVREFENKSAYPLDYQIFMEEIGEIEISIANCLCTKIKKPIALLDVGIEDGLLPDPPWQPKDKFHVHLPKFILVIGYDITLQTLAFHTEEDQYGSIVSWESMLGGSPYYPTFLDLFVDCLNSHVESSPVGRNIRFK